jgi:hypothetical protein
LSIKSTGDPWGSILPQITAKVTKGAQNNLKITEKLQFQSFFGCVVIP